jgi:hypothetical protein
MQRMGKRLAAADSRRFFDEFEKVRVSRFRATGVIDPAKNTALIPFPGGKVKLLGTKHTWFRKGGGWSYFICPGCGDRAVSLWLINDAPRCSQCCDAMNIKSRVAYGFGREARRRARDKRLDEIIAKLETNEPLRFKPAPEPWRGKAQLVFMSRNLTRIMRRNMVSLRLNQIASQDLSGQGIKAFQPLAASRQLIDVRPIWRASTSERLQQALDDAQVIIIAALNSSDPNIRLAAAKLMMRTKQARDRGLV